MNTIEKMRGIADMLLNEHKYSEAFILYDELYKQIWGAFSTVRYSSSGYTDYFNLNKNNFDQTIQTRCLEPVLNALCVKTLDLNLTTVLSELTSIIYGRLRCINSSFQVRRYISPNSVFTEFAILYSLMLQPAHQRKVGPIFTFAGTILGGNKKVKRVLSLYSIPMNEKLLAEYALSNKTNRLNRLNHLLLDYLLASGERKSDLFKKISKNVDPFSYTFHYSDYARASGRSSNYQRNNFRDTTSSQTFYPATATEEQKKSYYGKLMGLSGAMTKQQIHSKYISLISLYHPDRVQYLGPELKELAEMKSKEINAAYDWLKIKYHI
jgi:DnaJ like chaperone protein